MGEGGPGTAGEREESGRGRKRLDQTCWVQNTMLTTSVVNDQGRFFHSQRATRTYGFFLAGGVDALPLTVAILA